MHKALILSLALIVVATPAWAEKDKHSRNVVVIDRNETVVVTGNRKCPPGLAKKNNLCMPPGQYKKLYHVGGRLDRDLVTVRPVSRDILRRLDPAPWGYRYVRVDNDVLLVEKQTNEIDAIIELMNFAR